MRAVGLDNPRRVLFDSPSIPQYTHSNGSFHKLGGDPQNGPETIITILN